MAYHLSIKRLKLSSVNLNTTGDTATFTGLPTKYAISSLFIHDWSATPSALLAATLRDAATGGGNSLVGALAALNTPITATTLAAQAVPISSVLGATQTLTAATLYLNLSAANGTTLTANLTLFVMDLS